MSTDPRTGLDLHVQGDAQPEVVANEHLLVAAFLASGSVKSRATTAPPVSPAIGDAYLVPAGGTGAFAGVGVGSVAMWIGRWHTFAAAGGARVFVEDEAWLELARIDGEWAVPGRFIDPGVGEVWTGRRNAAGGKIYRKVVDAGQLAGAAVSKTIAHGITSIDLDEPVAIEVILSRFVGTFPFVPLWGSGFGGTAPDCIVDPTNITITSPTDASPLEALVALEYSRT